MDRLLKSRCQNTEKFSLRNIQKSTKSNVNPDTSPSIDTANKWYAKFCKFVWRNDMNFTRVALLARYQEYLFSLFLFLSLLLYLAPLYTIFPPLASHHSPSFRCCLGSYDCVDAVTLIFLHPPINPRRSFILLHVTCVSRVEKNGWFFLTRNM